MKRLVLTVALLMLVLGVLPAHAGYDVCVSILPQKYFLEKIGGPLVDVSVLVLPGASPATYEPTAKQMAGVSRAKAYFSIGVPFENTWLPRIRSANGNMVFVEADQGIRKRAMEKGHHGHDGHDHDEGFPDPHIWLSPELVKTIASNTCAGLVHLDPDNRATYEANLSSFLKEIETLDGDIRGALESVSESRRSFMVFHPSWGYFAREYGLKQLPIEVEGKSPSPRELAEIVKEGRELDISVIFVQPQFSDKAARVIAAEIGARVAVLDPLAEDWAANLRRAAESFRRELR